MIKWILQDVRRTLKSKKSFLLFFVMIISIFSFIINNLNKGTIPEESSEHEVIEYENPLHEYDSYGFFANYINPNCYYGDIDLSSSECDNFRVYNKIVEDTLNLNDPKEIRLLNLYLMDLLTDEFTVYYRDAPDKTKAFLDGIVVDMDGIIESKDRVKELTSGKFSKLEIVNAFGTDPSFFNYAGDDLKLQLLFYEKDLPENIDVLLAPSFFIVNYLQESYLILIIITLLVIYDSFYRDFKSGVTKTILSSPTRRFRYIFMKSCSSILSIMIIVLIPILMGYLYLKISLGFDIGYFPVSISNTTLNSIEPNLKFAPFMSDNMTPDAYSRYNAFCRIGPVGKYPVDMVGHIVDSSNVDCSMASLRQQVMTEVLAKEVIMLMTIYTLLVTLFISSLNSLCSLLFDSPVLNISISGGFIALGTLLNKLLIGNPVLRLLPTTFLNPGDLLFGTVPYTYFNGCITIGVWTLIIFIVTYVISKKKDFGH